MSCVHKFTAEILSLLWVEKLVVDIVSRSSDESIGLQRQLRGLAEVLAPNATLAEGQRHAPPAAGTPQSPCVHPATRAPRQAPRPQREHARPTLSAQHQRAGGASGGLRPERAGGGGRGEGVPRGARAGAPGQLPPAEALAAPGQPCPTRPQTFLQPTTAS